jgi:hypothetical protein
MIRVQAFAVVALLSLLPAQLRAQGSDQRIRYGEDLVIEAHESVGEAVCVGCSIYVHGSVARDAVAVGGDLEINGAVGQDAVAVGGSVRLGGTAAVGQGVVAVAGSVDLGPGAAVGQDVVAVLGKVERAPSASVGGDVIPIASLPVSGLLGLLLFFFLAAVVTHLVLVLLTYLIAGERRVETVAAAVRERAGLSLLTGLGMLVGAIVLFIVAALMGPVAPVLALLVCLALFLALVVGYTGLSFWVGRALARESAPLLAVLIGALIITVLQFIPILGAFACLAFFLLALGSAAVSGLGSGTNWLPQQFAAQPAGTPPLPPAAR